MAKQIRLKFSDAKPDPKAKITVKGSAQCGHTDTKDGPAAFAAQMIANIGKKDCKACRLARHDAEVAAARERRKQDGGMRVRPRGKGRLPDGARFDVAYDAAAVMWRGTLHVSGQVFTEEQPGVFVLLRRLDDQFRAWVRSQEAAAA